MSTERMGSSASSNVGRSNRSRSCNLLDAEEATDAGQAGAGKGIASRSTSAPAAETDIITEPAILVGVLVVVLATCWSIIPGSLSGFRSTSYARASDRGFNAKGSPNGADDVMELKLLCVLVDSHGKGVTSGKASTCESCPKRSSNADRNSLRTRPSTELGISE